MKKFLVFILMSSLGVFAQAEMSVLDANLLLAYTDTYADLGSRQLNSHLLASYRSSRTPKLSTKSFSKHSNGLFGDLSFRYVQTYEEDFNSPLFQMQFNIGGSYRVSSKMNMSIELGSGGWYSAQYGSVSFADADNFIGGVNGKPVWLQGASLSYALNDKTSFYFGKFATSPLIDKKHYNILWDTHAAPEGVYAEYQDTLSGRYIVNAKLSGFFVDTISPLITGSGAALLPNLDRASATDSLEDKNLIRSSNRFMWSLSTNVLMQNKGYNFAFNAAYSRIPTKNMPVSGNSFTRNSLLVSSDTELKRYEYNYSILDLMIRMDFKNLKTKVNNVSKNIPLSLSLQLIQNFGSGRISSASLETLGFVGGVVAGYRMKKQLNFSYHYFRLPTDVAFSNYVDYDIGGTGYNGHRLAMKYFLNEDMSIGLKYTLRGDESKNEGSSHFGFAEFSIQI